MSKAFCNLWRFNLNDRSGSNQQFTYDRHGWKPDVSQSLQLKVEVGDVQKPSAVWIDRGLPRCDLGFHPFRLSIEQWLILWVRSAEAIMVNRLRTLIPTKLLAIGGGLM